MVTLKLTIPWWEAAELKRFFRASGLTSQEAAEAIMDYLVPKITKELIEFLDEDIYRRVVYCGVQHLMLQGIDG